MNTKKVITILGVGGHGSSAYRDFVTNPAYSDYKINLILGADDCGGHSGEIQMVLPLMDINRTADSIIPMGDLRANGERFVFDMEPDPNYAKAKLDAMSGSYKGKHIQEFINKCYEFCRVFAIPDDILIQQFITFCTQYFKVYQQIEGLENKHKIGNLFLTFLHHYNNQNQEIFFNELKRLGFIPESVFPHFIYSERLDLKGANLDLEMEFNSEAEIDTAKVPISPSTYTLVKRSNSQPLTLLDIQENNPEVLEALNEAQLIVYSTGSIANLFGQINLLSDELKNNPAIKLWLGNIATTNNEVNFTVLMTYYYSPKKLGLDGVALQMSEMEFDNLTIDANDSTWVERYRKQGKTFVNITDLISNIKQVFNYNGLAKIVNLVQPALGITVAEGDIAQRISGWDSLLIEDKEMYKGLLERGGIKYVSTDVTSFIRFFYELNNYLCNELRIQDRTLRYQIVAFVLQKLSLAEKENAAEEIDFYTEVLATPIVNAQELKLKTEMFIQRMSNSNLKEDFSELQRALLENLTSELNEEVTFKLI